jgi:hypothetical protein
MKQREQSSVVKTSLHLPEALWRAARIRAAEDRSDLRTVVIAALESYLKTKRPARRED